MLRIGGHLRGPDVRTRALPNPRTFLQNVIKITNRENAVDPYLNPAPAAKSLRPPQSDELFSIVKDGPQTQLLRAEEEHLMNLVAELQEIGISSETTAPAVLSATWKLLWCTEKVRACMAYINAPLAAALVYALSA